MNDLVLHPRTKEELQAFIAHPGHNLLLIGPEGSGKSTAAHLLIATVLDVPTDKLYSHPYFVSIEPQKNSISIDAVRKLQDFTRLKTTGTKQLRRAILIQDAHALTTEAQNAFLKLLEEPPADTLIVLTAQGNDSLLPTILSRVPKIIIKTPSQADSAEYFAQKGYAQPDITRSYFISRGQAGLLYRLLQQNGEDQTLHYIDDAKKFLQAKPFERLVLVDQLNKQKVDLGTFLWALQRVADAALKQSAAKQSGVQVRHWQKVLRAVIDTQDGLSANPNAKLLLTNLSLQC